MRDWLDRWEAQQGGHMPHREERFGVMLDTLERLAGRPDPLVLDLGCGPGSLATRVLDRLPDARVVAVDADPVLLRIGRETFGDRDGHLTWHRGDLRHPSWADGLRDLAPFDAAVATTALHWLEPFEWVRLMQTLAPLLRPGGALVDGDHGGDESGQPRLHDLVGTLSGAERAAHRDAHPDAESWEDWWRAVETEPDLAAEMAERRAMWREHPHADTSPSPTFHRSALLACGFAEVGVVWQRLHDRVLVAIR